jgi:hypothetical protein
VLIVSYFVQAESSKLKVESEFMRIERSFEAQKSEKRHQNRSKVDKL